MSAQAASHLPMVRGDTTATPYPLSLQTSLAGVVIITQLKNESLSRDLNGRSPFGAAGPAVCG